MKRIEKSGKKKIILALSVLVIAVLAVVYLIMGIFFHSHFWFRTTINGVDCSGKNVSDVEQLIEKELEHYQLQLEGRVGQPELVKGTDIRVKPVFDGSLQKELESRSGFAWPISLFRETVIELETMVDYDEARLEAVMDDLECLKEENSLEPRDAYISEYREGKGYEIVPEEEGSLVDRAALKEALHAAVTNLQERVSLEDSGCYVEPKLRADNGELEKLLTELNTCVSTVLTYELGSAEEVLDGSTIHEWLGITEENEAVLDEEAVSTYVKELAYQYNTAYKARSFRTSYGTTVTLNRNEYGWIIDETGETEQLLADIRKGQEVSREPVYKQWAASHGEQDYGSTYVEINLTAQHLYFYKDGALVVESDFVSGNLAKGYDTPTGAYSVTYTERDAVLKGEDYRTPVNFWMPFNGGVGMHDANWRSDFGGNYYKTSGSHGCINLPYSAAEKIFENIKSGDPVFVYELPGTESAKSVAQDAAAGVTNAINAIGNVTLDSQAAIQAARSAYDSLSDQGKSYVKNYDALTNAEAVYGNLVAEQQAQQAAAQAQTEAAPVIQAIDALGEITPESREAVIQARKLYDALSFEARQYVTNAQVLVSAEAKLQGLTQD